MNSTILRRVAGARTIAQRPLAQSSQTDLRVRSYATQPSEEVDPQLNGYPQLPFVSRQYLPAKGWQDQLLRRNFGDTLHEQDELLSMWGPDIPPIAPHIALLQFTLASIGFVGFGFLVKHVLLPDIPAVRREYPFSGLVAELGGLEENKARPEAESDED